MADNCIDGWRYTDCCKLTSRRKRVQRHCPLAGGKSLVRDLTHWVFREVDVLLIRPPYQPLLLQQLAKMGRRDDIVREGRIVSAVKGDRELRESSLHPNIVGLGRVNPIQLLIARDVHNVQVLAGVRNVSCIRITGGHQAVDERRGRVTIDRMRRRHRRWLRPIVILERDVEDRADAFRLRQTGDQKGEEGNANRFGHRTNARLARRHARHRAH